MNVRCYPGFLFFLIVLPIVLFEIPAYSDDLSVNSSSQFSWGDMVTGKSEPMLAETLQLRMDGVEKVKISGFGRVSQDFGDAVIQDPKMAGRLYFMFLDYSGFKNVNMRFGRQLTSSSTGVLVLDGLTLDMRRLTENIGMSFSTGMENQAGLNSDFSSDKKPVVSANFFLRNVSLGDAEIGYMRKYDDSSTSREILGFNASSSTKWGRPYVSAMYNMLGESFDAMTVGLDVYPSSRLSFKGEYYQAYPTFDTTSIYSVFAVDKYSEYLARASYDYTLKSNIFASLKRQMYEENDSAYVASAGGVYRFYDKSSINATVDHRQGVGGWLWGGEAYVDHGFGELIKVSAGIQRDIYQRPVTLDAWRSASRYWIGLRYSPRANLAATFRLEENSNERFTNQYGGRGTIEASF